MSNVLKITKPDKTVHIVPISNKIALSALNNRLKEGQKWLIEEIDEAAAKDIPFIDESYVTAGEALQKNKQLSEQLTDSKSKLDEQVEKNKALSDQFAESEKKIAELEALLASGGGVGSRDKEPAAMNAEDKIALIKSAESVGEVNDLLVGDKRKGVLNAGEKRIAELEGK